MLKVTGEKSPGVGDKHCHSLGARFRALKCKGDITNGGGMSEKPRIGQGARAGQRSEGKRPQGSPRKELARTPALGGCHASESEAHPGVPWGHCFPGVLSCGLFLAFEKLIVRP